LPFPLTGRGEEFRLVHTRSYTAYSCTEQQRECQMRPPSAEGAAVSKLARSSVMVR
jgi:hypothetical protein